MLPTSTTPVKGKEEDYNPVSAFATLLRGTGSQPSSSGESLNLPSLETWIFDCCITLDPKDSKQPFKNFPRHSYLSELCHQFETENLILCPKSRQMLATWFYVAASLWYTFKKDGRITFYVSKKEDDAGFASDLSLLSRAWFIINHLPNELRPSTITRSMKPPVIRVPRMYSSIQAMSQNADALRMFSASLIICDEWAFQEQAYKAYAAMIPTIEGGGKIVGISTPNGKANNLFYDLVHDVQTI